MGDISVAVMTVANFAKVLAVPVDRLVDQLRLAGLKHTSPTDAITDDHKLELLTYLRHGNGKQAPKLVARPTNKTAVAKPTLQREGSSVGSSALTDKAIPVFISYSWEDGSHQRWVKKFAAELRANGVEAILDQWELHPGDGVTHFMEKSISTAEFVVIICTPRYKQKADTREGGVGYEGAIISAELYRSGNRRKYIPMLRGSDWTECAPHYLQSSMYIDVREGPAELAGFRDLLLTIFGRREAAPPLGEPPAELTRN